ncbi:hypothetical protein chiPu_0005886 [Chiloscyllium punctatum]|uniref:Uncharacterized protein n=1 Tax=Chiloscyllium punctatum TaxID=137246 RepID=A0A401SAP4_CHIPU|nr:hypothetical protein [Chiloscyllium punctatum]
MGILEPLSFSLYSPTQGNRGAPETAQRGAVGRRRAVRLHFETTWLFVFTLRPEAASKSQWPRHDTAACKHMYGAIPERKHKDHSSKRSLQQATSSVCAHSQGIFGVKPFMGVHLRFGNEDTTAGRSSCHPKDCPKRSITSASLLFQRQVEGLRNSGVAEDTHADIHRMHPTLLIFGNASMIMFRASQCQFAAGRARVPESRCKTCPFFTSHHSTAPGLILEVTEIYYSCKGSFQLS